MDSEDVVTRNTGRLTHSESLTMPVTSCGGFHETTMRDSQKTMIAHAQNRGRMDSLSVKCLIGTISGHDSVRERSLRTYILRHTGG